MSVRVDANRRLFFDFVWRGQRVREYLGVEATRENTATAEAWSAQIRAELRRGTFDYRRHFPRGAHLARFYGTPDEGRSVADYLADWQRRRSAETFHSDGRPREGASLHPTTVLHEAGSVRILSREVGHLALSALTPRVCAELRTRLLETRKAKTVRNLIGVLHVAMRDAVTLGEVPANPVVIERVRASSRTLPDPQPLSPDEIARVLDALPGRVTTRAGAVVDRATLVDLYSVWARTGWRSNEVVALRFDWLDHGRRTVTLRSGRSPRSGGLEATPKTGQRLVDCSYDPAIFAAFERRRVASLATGHRDYVWTDSLGKPLSQEWLAKRVWNPTLRLLGIAHRGQYALRDTFITLALSAGEDPGWVARVCGTSERMIWTHYRGYIAHAVRQDGAAFAAHFGSRLGSKAPGGDVSARKI